MVMAGLWKSVKQKTAYNTENSQNQIQSTKSIHTNWDSRVLFQTPWLLAELSSLKGSFKPMEALAVLNICSSHRFFHNMTTYFFKA